MTHDLPPDEAAKYAKFIDYFNKTHPVLVNGYVLSGGHALYHQDRTGFITCFEDWQGLVRRDRMNHIEKVLSFRSNRAFVGLLEPALSRGLVVPFVGAGVSIPCGKEGWKDFLCRLADLAKMDPVGGRLDQGEYEEVAQEIIERRGKPMFDLEVEARYSSKPKLAGSVLQIRALTEKFVFTTNFDEVLEIAFRTHDSAFDEIWHSAIIPDEIFRPTTGPEKLILIKLHGDAKYTSGRVFNKSEYDHCYGAPLDMDRPLPKLLGTMFARHCMLFIGCSLCSDRTLEVLRHTIEQEGLAHTPRHFAILECPDDGDVIARETFLTDLNIVPIWFPKGDFAAIEALLEHLIQTTGRLQP